MTGDIRGARDVEAIAGSADGYPFRAQVRGSEAVIEEAGTGREIGQFPTALDRIAPHPCGRIWAGAGGDGRYVAIINLEGELNAAPNEAQHRRDDDATATRQPRRGLR